MRHPLCPGEAGIPVALLSRMRIAFAFAQRFAGSKDGKIRYTQRVSLKALDAAMAKADHDASVDLGERVLFLHGVPDRTALPRTAASLPGVPAQMTLPIACGKLVVAK